MIPAQYASQLYAVFRIVFGLLFVMHGLQKLAGMFGGMDGAGGTAPLASLFGVAGTIEVVAGTLITIGLFTAPAAFLASGMMAVAYFRVHFPMAPWPIMNGGEPAVMNCFAFLYMSARGSGIWSVDAARRGSAR
jgi:putative oxidoreductase